MPKVVSPVLFLIKGVNTSVPIQYKGHTIIMLPSQLNRAGGQQPMFHCVFFLSPPCLGIVRTKTIDKITSEVKELLCLLHIPEN